MDIHLNHFNHSFCTFAINICVKVFIISILMSLSNQEVMYTDTVYEPGTVWESESNKGRKDLLPSCG